MKLQLDPTSSKPLHLQAEELLRGLISQEEYRKGKLLPNEVELSREMNISRNTLRQAINKLVFEGVACPQERVWNDGRAPERDEQRAQLVEFLAGNAFHGDDCQEFRASCQLAVAAQEGLASFSNRGKIKSCCVWSACADGPTWHSSILFRISIPTSVSTGTRICPGRCMKRWKKITALW